ncbi:GyrI-like domain-containing protein [soil metagenome]
MDQDQELQVEITELSAQPVMAIRAQTTKSGVPDLLRDLLPEVSKYLDEQGVHPTGPPFARWFRFEDEGVDVQAGMPVSGPIAGKDRITAGELPGGQVAMAWHTGPYDTLSETYERLHDWIHGQGRDDSEAPWEVYWTDPEETPDSSQWRTQIVWPLS